MASSPSSVSTSNLNSESGSRNDSPASSIHQSSPIHSKSNHYNSNSVSTPGEHLKNHHLFPFVLCVLFSFLAITRSPSSWLTFLIDLPLPLPLPLSSIFITILSNSQTCSSRTNFTINQRHLQNFASSTRCLSTSLRSSKTRSKSCKLSRVWD